MTDIKAVTTQKIFLKPITPTSLLKAYNKEEVLLFESADHSTSSSEKSVFLKDMALRIKAHNDEVLIQCLTPEARCFIKALQQKAFGKIIDKSDDHIRFFIEPLHKNLDLLEKMHKPSALDALRKILSSIDIAPDKKHHFMLAGAFAYDFLDHFEELPQAINDHHNLPDYLFFLPLTTIVIDHKNNNTTINCHAINNIDLAQKRLTKIATNLDKLCEQEESFLSTNKKSKLNFKTDINTEDFCHLVDKCKEFIRQGEVYQIVPSRSFSRPISDPIKCYEALKSLNPSPYMFFMRSHEWQLFGASPETFIKVDNGGKRVQVKPIAGTRRRGFDSKGNIDHGLDYKHQASLMLDEKELSEHMMLVDLARNDIASIAKHNTRHITKLLQVEKFSHVMHLISKVEGELKDELDALSAYQACMNMGTLMGAPKVRAATLLRKVEKHKRGFYGGAIGYINLLGDMDTAIIIRSALVKNSVAHIRAGCGVVQDSINTLEEKETINKAEAVLKAIEHVEG